ncbi:MAG: right-handed parallel beta-helix repeat-containing protein [bacterium]
MAHSRHQRSWWIVISLGLAPLVLTVVIAAGLWSEPGEEYLKTHRFVDAAAPNARDDGEHGSIDKPWKTLKYALLRLQPGQVLLIRGGTYELEGLALTEQNSGRADAPIMVKAYPSEEVLVQDSRPIRFDGANWWIIDGLRFNRFGHIRFGLHENLGYERTVAAEHIIIRNCEFANGEESALSINYGRDILIENNHFHHVRPGQPFSKLEREANAVQLRYIADRIVIKNNRFEDIGSDGVHVGTQSYLPGSDIGEVEIIGNVFWVNRPYLGILGNIGENGIDVKKCRGPVVISENEIHGFRPTVPEQDASGAKGDGLIIHGEAYNVLVDRNLFYDNTAHLNVAKGDGAGPRNIIIRNNILRESVSSDNPGYTVEGSALQVRFASGIYVYHNTFVDNHRYLVTADTTDAVFKNNIVLGGRAQLDGNHIDWEADYNAWSQLAGPVPATLQGRRDLSAHDLSLGPDFRPQSDSPLVGAGQDVGVGHDYDGRPRGNPPDVGALEHNSG